MVAGGALKEAADIANEDSDKSKKKKSSPPLPPPLTDPKTPLPTAQGAPYLKEVLDEQVASFKQNLVQEQFFPPFSSSEQLSLQDNGQALGSLFAHNTLKDLNDRISDYPALAQEIQKMKAEKHFPLPMGSHKNSLDFGHREIDRRFSTNYAPLYKAPGKETNFNTLAYQMRGEKALSQGYFPQAVHDFSKAIELGAPTPLPYLERGVAHFRLGQYDKSLKDYHTYTSQTQKAPLSIPDFSLGFAKGLPRGIYDSGEGLFLLVSDLVTRPVQTGDQMWEALKVLGNLARTEQWSVLSEALAPEVHKLV
ncbi:MAG: hypothetical protein HYZ47_00645, partial [Simkania negevensis]|nr:hypothetical protein [Simkania negevensis]